MKACNPSNVGIAVMLAMVLVACGGGSRGALTPKNPFPSRDVLEKIAATPPKPSPARAVAAAPGWRVDPMTAGETQPRLDAKIGELAGNVLQPTPEMRCAARELARFFAEHGAHADQRLQRFIVGACGATVPQVVTAAWTLKAPADLSDDGIIDSWTTKPEIHPSVRGGQGAFWLARKDDRAVLMLVAAKKNAELTVSPVDPETNRIVIRGVVRADSEDAIAAVNQGRDGVAACDRDRSVALPEIAFSCPLAPSDAQAWIDVATRVRGQLLARVAATLLARRDPAAPVEYVASTREPPPPGVGFEAAVLDVVNRARTGAGRAALSLAASQSAFNAKLAPHLVVAEQQGDASTSDTIALGLLAGYEVQGTIRKGEFLFGHVAGTSDVARWLDYALDLPLGRFTLLDPDARQIAIGPTTEAGIGAAVTTYSFFGAEDPAANARRVIDRITGARAAKGLPAPEAMGALPSLAAQAKLVQARQREPLDALDMALAIDSERYGMSLRGWAFTTSDLDAIALPPELLAPGPLRVAIEVTHYRAEGLPWGSYLVYVVVLGPRAAPRSSTAAVQRIQRCHSSS